MALCRLPRDELSPPTSSATFRATSVALFLGSALIVSAQTVTGFTNVSGWSGMKTDATTYLADRYDTEAGAPSNGSDPTKQNSLNGSDSVWNMVGNQSTYLFQVASGTTSSGAA
jgi:hypothetical protein